jgi:hypothetical protein
MHGCPLQIGIPLATSLTHYHRIRSGNIKALAQRTSRPFVGAMEKEVQLARDVCLMVFLCRYSRKTSVQFSFRAPRLRRMCRESHLEPEVETRDGAHSELYRTADVLK